MVESLQKRVLPSAGGIVEQGVRFFLWPLSTVAAMVDGDCRVDLITRMQARVERTGSLGKLATITLALMPRKQIEC